jgi:hypothetical protein
MRVGESWQARVASLINFLYIITTVKHAISLVNTVNLVNFIGQYRQFGQFHLSFPRELLITFK